MKKIVLSCILFLGLGLTTSFAQSEKMKEKATEKVEQLNAELIAGDKSLALSEEQKKQVFDIHLERLIAVKKANKSGADKEEMKEVNKKYFKKIFQGVLSKEQMKARKAGKEKLKG